ncbi:dihydrolipoyl dehydrogenase [Methyloversatilis thermotolerans]|uniref:dihydrolipoyl dehydrogenase n=1 Tax=Methyloversatilis thermotolerans TaxID=1346290 RepID=UPI00039B1302|nr:dihydrolipoyl dehydrogenase [Methyloversatilis thermotolerans]
MNEMNVDVAVIGAGTAGLAAYRAAIAAGRSAVIIEGGPYGTTCARVGCMPSKLLIAAAEAAHATAKWDAFGIRLDGVVRIDGEAVMARVRRERDRFVGFVVRGVDSIPAGHKLRGYAKFVDDHSLTVDDHTVVTFGRAVIATGSSPAIPPMLKAAGRRLIVNDDVFEWTTLPKSVAVFGPGVIGLELGQALHRLGVRVEVFGRGGFVGPFSDPALKAYATNAFADEFPLHVDAKIARIAETAEGVRIVQEPGDGRLMNKDFEWVIAATGRTPNVRNLGLENTSLALADNGVPIFDRTTMQCGGTPVFIAGDANNDLPLLHEAADEGRIAGDNAARFPDVQPGLRREPIAVVFSDPQLATVGKRHADLAPDSFVTGEVSFEDQGRSRVMLRNKGLLHVYAEKGSGRLLGCEMMGPDVEHLAHLLAWAMQSGMTVQRALEMPFYHPVVEEGLRTALRDAAAKLSAA